MDFYNSQVLILLMRIKRIGLLFLAAITMGGHPVSAQSTPMPEGRRLREIIAEKYLDGRLLIGGTTGSWAFGTSDGEIMDREFSYVTPENDFKHSVVRGNPSSWNWSSADAWKQHIIDNGQVLRIHGPIGPQCSNWAREDTRTAQELSQELNAFMKALCQRYNNVPGIEYLDVVNEIALEDGSWHHPKDGTSDWENPWLIIGQDSDPNQTPLYVKQAFAIAKQYAPNLKLILNNHCHPGTAGMEKVKETILYLRERGYRVDGLGWQGHVNVGWATDENIKELRKVMDWCRDNNLEFHVTEFSAWISDTATQSLDEQAYTYKAVIDVLWEKQKDIPVGWNTWHISDASGWHTEMIPSMFDADYYPKPAYYAVQEALESIWDFAVPYDVTFRVKSSHNGENLEGCEALFNGETKYSGLNGEVTFQDVTAGWYDLQLNKEHLAPLLKDYIGINSDTLITVWMDSARYEVSFHLIDSYSQKSIYGADVVINTLVQKTDINGMAVFSLPFGSYATGFHSPLYKSHESVYQVVSDTMLTILLDKTYGEIKFRIKNGDIPVNNALVVLENDSLYTNSLGICTFEFIPFDSNYQYAVSKEYYIPASGALTMKWDTTINLQLSRSVANVQFIVSAQAADAMNAFIVLDNDTVWVNKDGNVRFYNVPLDAEYTYRVLSDNYPEFSDQIFLGKDTTVTVFLTTGINFSSLVSEKILVYPNPASNQLNICSGTQLGWIQIFNASGTIVHFSCSQSTFHQIDISEFPSGFYWIRIEKPGNEAPRNAFFVIRH